MKKISFRTILSTISLWWIICAITQSAFGQMVVNEQWVPDPLPDSNITGTYIAGKELVYTKDNGILIRLIKGAGLASGIMKFADVGKLQWYQPIGTIDTPIVLDIVWEEPNGDVSSAGFIMLFGPLSSTSHVFLMKLDASGVILDSHAVRKPKVALVSTAHVMARSDQGDLWVAELINSGSFPDRIQIVKRDSTFTWLWSQKYYLEDSALYSPKSITLLPQGGALILVYRYLSGVFQRGLLMRVNDTGGVVWEYRIADSVKFVEMSPPDITPAGNVVISYNTIDVDSVTHKVYRSITVDCLNLDGTVCKKRTYTFDDGADALKVRGMRDGGVVLVGRLGELSIDRGSLRDTLWRFFMMRMNSDLDSLWTLRWGTPSWCHLNDVVVESDGNFLVTGSGQKSKDLYLARVTEQTSSVETGGSNSYREAHLSLSLYPNPVNSQRINVTAMSGVSEDPVTLWLYERTGNLVCDLGSIDIHQGHGTSQIDVSTLPSGVYSLVIQQNGRIARATCTVIQ